jgi:hypothetical protein
MCNFVEKEPCDPVTQKSPCNNIGGIMKAQVDAGPSYYSSEDEKEIPINIFAG